MSYLPLYESLFDAWTWIKNSVETEYAKHIFKANYVYNDSRLEGVATTKEATAEIVEDLENNRQASVYCDESYDAYCHVAGHSSMYNEYQRTFRRIYVNSAKSCLIFMYAPS